LLQKQDSDTVDRISTTVGLAPATIRRHLDILQRDQLVAYNEIRKKTGRPKHSFYLTELGQETLPKHYDTLLGMVVRELAGLTVDDTREKNGQDILELVFANLSEDVVDRSSVAPSNDNMAQRLDGLLNHLQKEDFYPDAVVENTGLEIRLHNCPFRSVALQNEAVCALDLNIISSTLGFDVTRSECITEEGATCCVYTAEIPLQLRTELSPTT
jgi:predicted ArsR family transcriptional regulator